jgi:hypothetical protein
MGHLLDDLGVSIEQPETCWDVMANHKGVRVVIIVLGLYVFSRLVTVILDVHRFAFFDVINAAVPTYFFTSIDRGSFWQSTIIGSFSVLVIIPMSLVTAIATGRKTNGNIKIIFWEMLGATTIRLPIFFGIGLIVVYFSPQVMIYHVTPMLIIWASCFGLGLIEMWRVAGTIAIKHEAKARIGIIPALLVTMVMVALSVAITLLIGGFD